MRIIAGKYKSRPLKTLKGDSTRPTLDKVKEAIFSSVGPYFEGGICFDCFAGSGAIGLECLSRGMDKAILVDNNYEAIKVIKENVALLNADNVLTIKGSYQKGIDYCVENKIKLNFIYLDPPYVKAKEYINKILKEIKDHDLLSDNGVIVIESLKEDSFLDEYSPLIKIKEVVYGIMKITYFKKEGN